MSTFEPRHLSGEPELAGRAVARDLPVVEGPPDQGLFARFGIPMVLIVVIIAIGIPLFLRLLGQLR